MVHRLSASARHSSKFIKLEMMGLATYYYASQGGVICQCVIAKFVVSRFPKDRDIRKQWVFVVKRVSTENNARIPGAKHNDYDVVCQHHLTDSD